MTELKISAVLAEEENKRLKSMLDQAQQVQANLAEESRLLNASTISLDKELNATKVEAKMLKQSLDNAEKQAASLNEESKQNAAKLEQAIAHNSGLFRGGLWVTVLTAEER